MLGFSGSSYRPTSTEMNQTKKKFSNKILNISTTIKIIQCYVTYLKKKKVDEDADDSKLVEHTV